MDLHHPLRVITPTVDGDVLIVLARADHAFTPPEVHQLVGERSESGVRKALERLAAQGLVHRTRVGQAHLYSLNRDHLAAKHVIALSSLRDDLIDRIGRALGKWEPGPTFAALFGSAAHGPMRANSDIDIFVVRPDVFELDDPWWRKHIDRVERQVTSWTGNDARVFEMSDHEVWTALQQDAPPRVLADIESEGIVLHGERTYFRRLAAIAP